MALSRTETVRQMIEWFIHRQYAANRATTLGQIRRRVAPPYQVHPELLAFLVHERENIHSILLAELEAPPTGERPRLVDLFLAATEDYIRQNNQFLSLTEAEREALEAVYTRFLRDQRDLLAHSLAPSETAEGLRNVIARHLLDLQAFVDELAETHGHGGVSLVDRQVVNAEYPARLQLRVLGLRPERLRQPALDVGCGRQGLLVQYLRERGWVARSTTPPRSPLSRTCSPPNVGASTANTTPPRPRGSCGWVISPVFAAIPRVCYPYVRHCIMLIHCWHVTLRRQTRCFLVPRSARNHLSRHRSRSLWQRVVARRPGSLHQPARWVVCLIS